jgi:hypothetical protein
MWVFAQQSAAKRDVSINLYLPGANELTLEPAPRVRSHAKVASKPALCRSASRGARRRAVHFAIGNILQFVLLNDAAVVDSGCEHVGIDRPAPRPSLTAQADLPLEFNHVVDESTQLPGHAAIF